MAKKSLILTLDDAPPSIDFTLISIVSAQKSYRLAALLNEDLAIGLERTDDHELFFRNTTTYFPFFISPQNEEGITFRLLGNKSGAKFLAKEFSYADYFLICHDVSDNMNTGALQRQLQNLDCVQWFKKEDVSAFKSINNLIFQ